MARRVRRGRSRARLDVLTTGAVFAVPVAAIGLGFALDLARGITSADTDFRKGKEKWGGDGNATARLITGAEIGIIGFGDLGRALNRLLSGFRCTVRAYDPWLPPSILKDNLIEPASPEEVLSKSDFVFVLAAVTSESRGLLGPAEFAMMRPGSAFVLLSGSRFIGLSHSPDRARQRLQSTTRWPGPANSIERDTL